MVRKLLPPLLLVLIVTGAFWKLLTKQFTWLDSTDLANQVLPWMQFQAESWHNGEFPLWDPHGWGGQPLIGQLQPGGAYPPNWLMFMLPFKDGRIQQLWVNLFFILDHCLAALFCYSLCRDLKRSQQASLLGGAIFALSGIVGSLGWPQMLHGAIWIPLVLLFFLRSIRLERPIPSAALAGTFLGVSLLSGHHQIPIFIGAIMAGLWIWQFWKRPREMFLPAVTFFVLTAMVGAFQILPAQEYGRNAIRFVGTASAVYWNQSVPYAIHEHPEHSLFPSALVGLLLPNVTSHDAFVGLTAATLALLGFATAFRKREVRILGAIAVGAMLIALGKFSVFHGIAYLIVPMIEKARTPAMALTLVQFSIAVLAAYGMDACRTRAWNRWFIPCLAGFGALIWTVLAVLASVRPETEVEYDRLAVIALVALALAAILYGWQRRNITSATAITLLILLNLFELGTVVGRNYQQRGRAGSPLNALEQNRDIVAFLRHQPQPIRLEIDLYAVPYNIGDWEGIDQFQAYLGGITSNVLPFGAEDRAHSVVSQKLFALNYYLGNQPIRSDQPEVFRGQSGLNVYQNLDAFPRVWTVHETAQSTPVDLMQTLKTTDLRHQVVMVETPPPLATCRSLEADSLQVTERTANRISLNARMTCKGMVILSETYFPGWQAKVDDASVEIHQAYGTLRGIVVPAGQHRVSIVYRPKSVYFGALLTVAGLLIAWIVNAKSKAISRSLS